MIVEQIELKEAYNELKTFLVEVHKCVHTEIEDPPEGSKALDHFKQKRIEYKKYLFTMSNLVETLKSSSESLKKSVTEIIKISPDSYVDIQKQANEFLKECPYPKLVSEVTHLQCALKLLCDETSNKIGEIKNILYKQSKHVSPAIQADQSEGKEMKMKYLTSDDESDYIKKPIKQKKRPKSIDHRDQEVPLKNYENNREVSGLRSTDDLIQLVTTILKNNNEQNRTKFPELKIPTYNGERGEYDEFWAVFNQMVHTNTVFSPVEKFIYLTNCLTGRAANAIRGIKIIPDNYQQAIEIIRNKFGNKTNNEASIVQQLERVKSADYSSSNCRQVFENIQTLIQQLKSLGRDITEDDDPLWKQLIYKKFPASIRKKVFLKMQENNNIWKV
uniref:Retrotrans_gag domain-containing protein n=1 Tax=Heterorhabditis bacteriophora TaxID=37862 RepID=A0A1I7WH65_HETBA